MNLRIVQQEPMSLDEDSFSEPINKDNTTYTAEDRSQQLKEILEWLHNLERKKR